MKDVSAKPETLRSARAQAIIHVPPFCVPLLRDANTEKGDALAAARVAGIMAVKRTWELIPLCHPLAIQTADVAFDLGDDQVRIEVEVQLIANTGVEMEALTGASVAALTLYDMLKPHAGTDLSIGDVHLLEKRGGKSHYKRHVQTPVSAAVLVLSDSVAAGREQDTAGHLAEQRLRDAGLEIAGFEVLPDEAEQLQARLRHWVAAGADLIVTAGGTGVGPRDRTVDTVAPMLERELPGIMETARAYGQKRMPYAMLSRGVAGLIGHTLVITLPGSRSGVRDSLNALIPGIFHTFDVLNKTPHEHGYED